jgi:hypothetical protein
MTQFNRFYIESIASVCHEANRAICEAAGDMSQKSWNEAEDWQRESAIQGVQFAISFPDAPHSAQHGEWMNHKVQEGWGYGPIKDATLKEHPCMVPYEDLPFEQKVKDHVFKAIVKSMA